MTFDKDGNICIITHDALNFSQLANDLKQNVYKYKDNNVVLNLTTTDAVSLDELISVLPVSNLHRASKQSFVIVTDKVDFDDVPDELIVVPTLQEAYDIIEMEEMERDLGLDL